MDYQRITQQYYSLWIGQNQIIRDSQNKISFLYSPERNRLLPGYPDVFDILALYTGRSVFISYGDKASLSIDRLKAKNTQNITDLCNLISEIYRRPVSHHIKFCYTGSSGTPKLARVLNKADYGAYLDFFKKSHRSCSNTDWVYDYFNEMVEEELCCGVFAENELVSCTDLPLMPYMADSVQEIGVNTLPEYRGNGFATEACLLCITQVISKGKCPQWSCDADNIASIHTAEKVGFRKFADVITVTL